jgi:hypothetical protein
VQFTPLAKGVRVLSIQTEIRENTCVSSGSFRRTLKREDRTVIGKNGQEHADSNPVHMSKQDIERGSHVISRNPSRPPSRPLSRTHSRTNVQDGIHGLTPPHLHSPRHSGSGNLEISDLQRRLANLPLDPAHGTNGHHHSGTNSHESPEGARTPQEAWMPDVEMEPAFNPLDHEDLPPEEIHMIIKIPLPTYTSPTSNVQPAMVSHRIKWACMIMCVSVLAEA